MRGYVSRKQANEEIHGGYRARDIVVQNAASASDLTDSRILMASHFLNLDTYEHVALVRIKF